MFAIKKQSTMKATLAELRKEHKLAVIWEEYDLAEKIDDKIHKVAVSKSWILELISRIQRNEQNLALVELDLFTALFQWVLKGEDMGDLGRILELKPEIRMAYRRFFEIDPDFARRFLDYIKDELPETLAQDFAVAFRID